ncbi:MAG: Undecaprenyl-diphosphatase BcrC [Bacteroidetes bacterium ADurb.BinA245]|jgi:membrane-associated phospholipid phosphatase|nr:phosphatase PAP2 family protein [Chitinophagaceae bacterium]OPZ16695.1 MAG: Undecaprenyl-diphosphatase BcrC [Bacteroidetes bacterium ADurb.BinA245]HRF23707.1 phosphatase PAP2 family protein [Chitinophagaceae bacterium]
MKSPVFTLLVLALIMIQTPGIAQQKKYAGLDYLHKLQDKRTESKNSFNKFISGSATPVSLATPFSLWIAGMVSNNKALQKDALFSLESFAMSQALTFGIKAIVNKPRPHEADPTLIALRNAKNGSFPSGHTSEAFATATSLTLITKKWYIAVPAYTWASLVGYSRMYLGVHYPSDVIGGAFLGAGSAYLTYKLNKWMHPEKKKLKKPKD